MRKSQLRSGFRGLGVEGSDVIVPPALTSFETAYSPDLDPLLANKLSADEYEALTKHRQAMNGLQIKKHKHYDQVQANAVVKANLEALKRRANQADSQMSRRNRKDRTARALPTETPEQQEYHRKEAEEYSMGRATPINEQARQKRDGRHVSSTGKLPIAPPAAVEVRENLLKGTEVGPKTIERSVEPLVTSSLGVNLRPEEPGGSKEVVVVQPLKVGTPPSDIQTSETVPVPRKADSEKAGGRGKGKGRKAEKERKESTENAKAGD